MQAKDWNKQVDIAAAVSHQHAACATWCAAGWCGCQKCSRQHHLERHRNFQAGDSFGEVALLVSHQHMLVATSIIATLLDCI